MLEKTPESPLDSKEIKPVNLREINSEYSLEGLTLKLQCFGKVPDARKDLRAEGEEAIREGHDWMASLVQWT